MCPTKVGCKGGNGHLQMQHLLPHSALIEEMTNQRFQNLLKREWGCDFARVGSKTSMKDLVLREFDPAHCKKERVL